MRASRIRGPIDSHFVRFGNPPAHHIRFIETGQRSRDFVNSLASLTVS
jgi:hypothetical protein